MCMIFRALCPANSAVVLLVGHWTCDSQVSGSNSSWAPPHSGLGQATYTCMSLSSSSIIWYWPRGWCFLAGKVTVGLAESSGSLLPGSWLKITCMLTAKRPWSAPSPALVNWVWDYFTFLIFVALTRFMWGDRSCHSEGSHLCISRHLWTLHPLWHCYRIVCYWQTGLKQVFTISAKYILNFVVDISWTKCWLYSSASSALER